MNEQNNYILRIAFELQVFDLIDCGGGGSGGVGGGGGGGCV